MIWTLVCFAITFFVLRKFAFGPIQKTIDERRERIRASVEEAEHARAEARRLLEEHKQLIGQAKSEAGEILAEARKVAESQRERAQEEVEADRQRRLEETRKQIDAETTRALEQIRAEVADLTLLATDEGDRQGARPRRPPQADRGRDRRPRLLRAGAREQRSGRRAPHVRARALPGRAGAGQARRRPRAARRLRRRDRRRARAAPRAREPGARPAARRPACSSEILGGADELVRNFVLLVAEKGRAGELEEIYRELDALVAAGAEAAHRRADDRLRALRGRGRVDHEEDRAGLGPHRRGDPQGRPEADRRDRPAGGLAARRRERPRPARAPAPRADDERA